MKQAGSGPTTQTDYVDISYKGDDNNPSDGRKKHRGGVKRLLAIFVISVLAGVAFVFITAPPKVRVVYVKEAAVGETIAATGTVRAEKSAELGVDVGGVVKQVHAREGIFVKSDTPLIVLGRSDLQGDIDAARAAVKSAEAELVRVSQPVLPSQLRQAQAELERAEMDGKAAVDQTESTLKQVEATNPNAGADASQTENVARARSAYDDAVKRRDINVREAREKLNTLLALPRKEDIAVARAKVEECKTQLQHAIDLGKKLTIKAPFDGTVTKLYVTADQPVTPGQKLVVLQDMKHLTVDVDVDQKGLGALSLGQDADIACDSTPGCECKAVLVDLGAGIDSTRNTIRVRFRPVGRAPWLRPDLTVRVKTSSDNLTQKTMVPNDSIIRYGHENAVLAVRKNVAVPVLVSLGQKTDEGRVVIGTLKLGDAVIRKASKVKPGSRVRIGRVD